MTSGVAALMATGYLVIAFKPELALLVPVAACFGTACSSDVGEDGQRVRVIRPSASISGISIDILMVQGV